jgi:glutamate synthase (NADPH/NADH) large chain
MKSKQPHPSEDGQRISTSPTPGSSWVTTTDVKTWLDERDACALVASIRKNGEATHGNLKRALAALSIMGHRSGEVNGEGDGCGVLTDIPRLLWAQALEHEGKPGWLAEDRRFFVGHLMIPNTNTDSHPQASVIHILQESGVDILLERPIQTRPQALGKMARLQAPHLWQVAGLVRNGPLENVERTLFDLALKIEKATKISVASLSSNIVVYKVRGSIETLYQYYPELRNPDFTTTITIGHARYSTNTATSFEAPSCSACLGITVINTVARLCEQAQMLGGTVEGRELQDLDRLLETLSIATFPRGTGIGVHQSRAKWRNFRLSCRSINITSGVRSFMPSAETISSFGDECVFWWMRLGRPLCLGYREGIFLLQRRASITRYDADRPRPLSPGERCASASGADKQSKCWIIPPFNNDACQFCAALFADQLTPAFRGQAYFRAIRFSGWKAIRTDTPIYSYQTR